MVGARSKLVGAPELAARAQDRRLTAGLRHHAFEGLMSGTGLTPFRSACPCTWRRRRAARHGRSPGAGPGQGSCLSPFLRRNRKPLRNNGGTR